MPTTVGPDPRLVADLRIRLERVQAAMAARGLGGLVLYASGQHNMLRMDQVRYLTDLPLLGPHGALVVPPRGEPRLVVTPRWDLARARELTGLAAVEACEAAELPARVASLARDLAEPLALGGWAGLSAAYAAALEQALDRPLVDADELV